MASCYFQISRIDSSDHHQQSVRPEDFFVFQFSPKFFFTDSNGQRYPRSPTSMDPRLTPCSDFFSNARDFLLDCVPTEYRMLLSAEGCNQMVDGLLLQVQSMFCLNFDSHTATSSNLDSKVLTLAIDIIFDLPYDEVTLNTILEEIHEEMQMEESMQDVRMIPASKESIKRLLKDSKYTDEKENQCCTICLEEFYIKKNDGESNSKVSVMPCGHEFHRECIRSWLETSHLCPLCRYSMPVDDN